jgi:succinoglycan biosynthesis transport protein ExoP
MSTTPLQAQAAMPAQAPADDEIDLGQLAASLKRRWKLIGAVAGGTLVLSGVVTLLQKPVWEGEFQIVLASSQESSGGRLAQLAASNPMLAGLAGLSGGGGKDSLETEVKVLESPSVLRPVFDFVRASKMRAGDNAEDLRYEDWANANLEVKLEKGTSVLNISYRDNDKALVLPVIEKISRAYQDYSGRDRRRDISNAVAYLQGRIADLTPKAEASMRRAQSFALANGLGLQDGMPAGGGGDNDGGGGGSVEASRMGAQAQVIALRQQLANARAAGGAVLFQAPQLEANKDLYTQYQTVESQLAEKRSRLRDNDPIIRNLQRQRSALASTLNRETIALLEGQLATAQARLQSASRPNQVVLQHRQLVREAVRDERTLTELENQLQLAQLEQAKQTDPWELISRPTLLDKPVSPRKGRNLALGLLAGLLLGSGAALVAERRSGRVFAIEELRAALPGELLAELPATDADEGAQTVVQLLASGPLAASGTGSLALIPVGLEPATFAGLREALEAACGRPVLCSTDLVACRSCATQLLITSPGAATREQLSALRQQLRLQGTPVAGWLLLKPASEG